MEVYVDVSVKSKQGIERSVAEIVGFCEKSKKWRYSKEKSKDLERGLPDGKAIVVTYKYKNDKVGLAFMQSGNKLDLINIVPRERGSLSISEYNDIAVNFYTDLKESGSVKGISITKSNAFPELDEIVTAKIPRKELLTYLNGHPLSYHPLDIVRLDRFTCSLARYSRKPVDIDLLGAYLMEKKSWDHKHCEWFCNRVKTGLDIVEAYKAYY